METMLNVINYAVILPIYGVILDYLILTLLLKISTY